MRHLLVGVGSAIGDDAITAFGDASLAGDTPEGAGQRSDFSLRGVRGEVVEGDVFTLRDHQNMRRGSGRDVIKREYVIVFVDFVAGDLAAQDAGEDVVAVVGQIYASVGLPSEIGAGALLGDAGGALAAGELSGDIVRRNPGGRPQHQ